MGPECCMGLSYCCWPVVSEGWRRWNTYRLALVISVDVIEIGHRFRMQALDALLGIRDGGVGERSGDPWKLRVVVKAMPQPENQRGKQRHRRCRAKRVLLRQLRRQGD